MMGRYQYGHLIPVAERLAEDYQMVLTCDYYNDIHIYIMFHHKAFEDPFGISYNHPRLHRLWPGCRCRSGRSLKIMLISVDWRQQLKGGSV